MPIKKIQTDFHHTAFVIEADRDYLAARLMNFCGNPMFKAAAYHSQQCLEKYLKALLVQEKNFYLETHNLKDLLAEVNNVGVKISSEVVEILEKFDNFEQVSRYGPFANYDPLKTNSEDFKTKGVFAWSDLDVKDLDKAVFLIRREIKFKSNSNEDGLAALRQDKLLPFGLSGWHLPGTDLKQVLISHNDHFN